jgi:hypothetical protein
MSTGQATVTAPVKAGLTATSVTLSDVREFRVDIEKDMLYITKGNGQVVEFAYGTIATVTYVIANKHATITVST